MKHLFHRVLFTTHQNLRMSMHMVKPPKGGFKDDEKGEDLEDVDELGAYKDKLEG